MDLIVLGVHCLAELVNVWRYLVGVVAPRHFSLQMLSLLKGILNVTMQASTLLKDLVVAFYLFLVRVNVLRCVHLTTVGLHQVRVALAVLPRALQLRVARIGLLLLKLLLRMFVHICFINQSANSKSPDNNII